VATTIEEIYPLTHLQAGLLFHTLEQPESPIYVEQIAWQFQGDFRVDVFEDAWQRIVERHQCLRTAFLWEALEKPLQIVHRSVRVAIARLDWRHLPKDVQIERGKLFLEEDRARGFDLQRAPLFRCTLIQLAADVYQFVWTNHHVILDGWSRTILLQEILEFYNAALAGREPRVAPAPLFREYIAWLQKQDASEAQVFWRSYLSGADAPTPMPRDISRAARGSSVGSLSLSLSHATSDTLQQLSTNTALR